MKLVINLFRTRITNFLRNRSGGCQVFGFCSTLTSYISELFHWGIWTATQQQVALLAGKLLEFHEAQARNQKEWAKYQAGNLAIQQDRYISTLILLLQRAGSRKGLDPGDIVSTVCIHALYMG